MGTFEFWRKWLLWANYMTMGVGLVVALAGNSIFLDPHNQATSRLFFGGNSIEGDMLLFKNWLFGIIGATIVGFHLIMIFIIQYPFKKKERWAHQALTAGLLSWFILDSSISAYYAAYYNIYLINLVALILIGVPLATTYQYFRRAN